MIFWKLFGIFFEIGAVSFGGGYGMISLVREKALVNGWLTEEEFLDLIAVSESTPGPLAVNMATFVGAKQAGILGALAATLGVILPSFLVILLIAACMQNLLRYRGVEAFLCGVRPCIVAMILATALTMALRNLIGMGTVWSKPSVNLPGVLILAFLLVFSWLWKKCRRKAPPPVLLIVISAGLGMAVFPLFV